MHPQEEAEEFYLFLYSFSAFSQKTKVKLMRSLLGYKNKKQKLYVHEGLLQLHDAEKLGQNVILIKAKKAAHFSSFFEKNKIPYTFKEVLIKQ
jgi:hypothetical protein